MNNLPRIITLLVTLSLFRYTPDELILYKSETVPSDIDESQSVSCESEKSTCEESQLEQPTPHFDTTQNIFESHGYFDGKIIEYVGVENYEAWVQAHLNTSEGADVYLFFEDFGITPEILKGMLTDYVYELYMEYWPAPDTGR